MHIIIGLRGGHLVALVGVKGPDHLRVKVGGWGGGVHG